MRNARQIIDALAAAGRYYFTTREAATALGVSQVAARAALRRIRLRGHIASPLRGFHLIVPPEYRSIGCLPPEQLVPLLMAHLDLVYYVGLLSAAELHGAAHHRPQVFHVVVASSRPDINCGEVQVQLVARRNAIRIPTAQLRTQRGYVRVSTPEATAFDLVGYAHHCGGLSNILTVLMELAERIDGGELSGIAPLSPLPWAQRLGFLLERSGAGVDVAPLSAYVARNATEYVPLRPGRDTSGAARSSRWKLLINQEVEPEV